MPAHWCATVACACAARSRIHVPAHLCAVTAARASARPGHIPAGHAAAAAGGGPGRAQPARRRARAAARGLLRGLLPRPRRVHAGCAGPAFPARLHGPAPMHVCLIGLSGAWRSAWALASTVLAPSTTGQCLTVWTNCAALCIPGLVSACGQQAGSQSTCLRTWLRSRRHSLPFAGGCPG